MLKKIIIWTIGIVFILPLVGFVVIIITQATPTNTAPGGKLQARPHTDPSASSTTPKDTASTTDPNQFLAKIIVGAYHYGDDTISSGFLVPTEESIPVGFVVTQNIYRPNAYILKFASATGEPLPKIEFMGSQKGTKPAQDAVTAYSNVVEQVASKGEKKVEDFTYLDSPGMVLTSTSFGITYEHLIWNDNGYVVSITAAGFPDGVMSPTHLIDILKTMVRN